jgi:hypothetical protein
MATPSSERDDHFDEQFESEGFGSHEGGEEELDRVETLIRLLYTLLFFLILRVVEATLGVIVFFQLVFALVTNRTPNPAVNSFARRVVEYGYQIAHYLTFNRDKPPFPFDELPPDRQPERVSD